ncbi:unnamed protein product [Linum trigynum]|uniref:Uncharacterized protein n=1 Tax=Linum trigynum TaxID=586398 RepID=A0AAV2G5G3_9ROSI
MGNLAHTVKDENLLLTLNHLFSKLKAGSNGDGDRSRTLEELGLSLSLSRYTLFLSKTRNPSLLPFFSLKKLFAAIPVLNTRSGILGGNRVSSKRTVGKQGLIPGLGQEYPIGDL